MVRGGRAAPLVPQVAMSSRVVVKQVEENDAKARCNPHCSGSDCGCRILAGEPCGRDDARDPERRALRDRRHQPGRQCRLLAVWLVGLRLASLLLRLLWLPPSVGLLPRIWLSPVGLPLRLASLVTRRTDVERATARLGTVMLPWAPARGDRRSFRCLPVCRCAALFWTLRAFCPDGRQGD